MVRTERISPMKWVRLDSKSTAHRSSITPVALTKRGAAPINDQKAISFSSWPKGVKRILGLGVGNWLPSNLTIPYWARCNARKMNKTWSTKRVHLWRFTLLFLATNTAAMDTKSISVDKSNRPGLSEYSLHSESMVPRNVFPTALSRGSNRLQMNSLASGKL